jgi:hypothetical protein
MVAWVFVKRFFKISIICLIDGSDTRKKVKTTQHYKAIHDISKSHSISGSF